ncbi:MAG TPA: FecR family protein, partial [Actinomycetota bacterium]|nr:FecR family protein [Actinomycetota bacterium]
MTEPKEGRKRRRARMVIGAAFLVAAVAVGAILLLAGPAKAKQFATLRVLDGSVQVSHDGEGFQPGEDGESLQQGDVVRTGAGRAEIEYFDGSITRLDRGSTLDLVELASIEGDRDSRLIEGRLDPGKTFNRVVEITDSQSRFDVATPTATASVRGTAHVTEHASDGTFTLWVLDGE